MNSIRAKIIMASTLLVLGHAKVVYAGPHGYDLHNTLAPASAGLAGTSIAQPQDTVSAVFGNPATLTQLPGTQFTFGATFYKPEVELEHDGSVTSGTGNPTPANAFSATSGTDIFPVPQIAVTQDLGGLNIPATLGLGLTVTSGIGSEFRGEPNSLGAGAEFIIFGVNAGLGYKVNPNLSLGAAVTISFAQLDFGLASTSAETHDLGLRATLGMTYKTGATTIGAFYQTEQEHQYDDIIQINANDFASPTITQPANFGIGIANDSLMGGKLLLMADIIHKRWGSAEFWEDIYDSQTVFSMGAQLTQGNWKYRVGYGYGEDPTDENASPPLGDLTQVYPGAVVPLSTPLVQYLQATQAEVIYKHRVTAGIGYERFLGVPFLNLDAHAGFQLEEDRDYGTHTNAEVSSWHLGFGLTWKF